MEWQTALSSQVVRVFETMLFAVSDGSDPRSEELADGFAVAFESPVKTALPCERGHLWVSLSEPCARDLIGAMVGDDDPNPESLRDGVSEIANVIVGQLFLENAPNEGHQLSAPVPMRRPDPEHTLAEVSMSFDSGVAHVVLSMNPR